MDGSANHGGMDFLRSGVSDGAGKRARFFVGEERHRADFAGAVTGLAMIFENGQHVAIKSRNGGVGRLSMYLMRVHRAQRSQQSDATNHGEAIA